METARAVGQRSLIAMSDFLVVSRADHDALVTRAYQARGYSPDEAAEGAKLAAEAARHGIRTHHALKALHLDHLFGSAVGGWMTSEVGRFSRLRRATLSAEKSRRP